MWRSHNVLTLPKSTLEIRIGPPVGLILYSTYVFFAIGIRRSYMFDTKSNAIEKLQFFCATWQQLQICAIMSFNNKWLRSIKPRANKYVLTLEIPTGLLEQGGRGQLPPPPLLPILAG